MEIERGKYLCKVCNSPSLTEFISFGKMPVANAFLKKEDLNKDEYTYEMAVGFCEKCHMVQLINIVPYNKYIVPDQTGKTHYAFFSSTSKAMENHFAEFAKEIEQRFLDPNSKVLEIGSNDGIMLQAFQNHKVLGIEPSSNVADVSVSKGIETINEFFTDELAKNLVAQRGTFRTILSTNVTLNIIEIHDLIKGISTLLDNRGVFITEDPYILDILEKNSYDQIYDEHIWYFSLTSLSNLYEMHGMEIFDAEHQDVHGGSMRVYACKKGTYEKTPRLKEYLENEYRNDIYSLEPYLNFSEKVKQNREQLIGLLSSLKSQGKKIVGYAAASKGTIVQNFCNIGPETIEYISDSTPYKQGLYSPGKKIPIVSPDAFHNDNADYALLGAWNHAKEITEKEKNFIERGGRFIIHLPKPQIVEPETSEIPEQTQEIQQETPKQFVSKTGIEIKKLKVFDLGDEGNLFETLRDDDEIYQGKFGQNLISFVNPGIKKGLHKHDKQTEYTTCIKGNLLYVAIKETPKGPIIEKIPIGEKNMLMIKTPPGVWHGYTPIGNEQAVLVYTMDRAYNSEDPDTDEKDVYSFGDVWSENFNV